MHPQITWTSKAERTLTSVAEFLRKKYGEPYSDNYLAGVRLITRGLAEYPSKGRPLDIERKKRRWNLDSHHYVVYETTDNGIRIISMLSIKQGY